MMHHKVNINVTSLVATALRAVRRGATLQGKAMALSHTSRRDVATKREKMALNR